MKKITAILLCAVLLLSMAACGGEPAPEKKNVDLNAVYESFGASLPEMWVLDEDMMLNMFGIKAEDCTQVITAIVSTGLNVDEVWLIEAKDAAALEQLILHFRQLQGFSGVFSPDDHTVYSLKHFKITPSEFS